jgi:hypothetical protein
MLTNIQTAVIVVSHFGILLLLSSLWTMGVNTLFQEDMILEKMGQWQDENLPLWVNKPLWRCPPCMASFHGSVIYLLFMVGDYGLWLWIPFIVCLAGVNYLIVNR